MRDLGDLAEGHSGGALCPFCSLSVPWGGLEHLAYNLRCVEAAPLTYSEPLQHTLCEYLVVNVKNLHSSSW